ncbi:MAG TPA: methionyl-tRNA formyltransferase [Verrucomicrobiaceae bacterium]|jgi:methionyl-tRNA formyltransferase
MRAVFFGAGDIGLPSLDALIRSPDHEVVAVVTQPDKPAGRGRQWIPSRIKTSALEAGVPVLQPEKMRDVVAQLREFAAEAFVVVAFGKILPRALLDVPSKACLNIHASLLPRHRGASPIQAAIREGDVQTGITIMWMDEGLDTGDVLLMEATDIAPDETGGTLHDRLALIAPACLMRALEGIQAGNAPRTPQDASRATLTKKLERRHGHISWGAGAAEIERLVRAYDPWPGSYCLLPAAEGNAAPPLKVHRAELIGVEAGGFEPGTILAAMDDLRVACGQGVIALREVQAEGRKRMNAADFLRGHPLAPGAVLS